MKKRLIFRAEANITIGRGHLSRCLAIADMLENDFEILFVFCVENKSYIDSLNIPYRFETILSDTSFFDLVNQEDIVWLDGYIFDENFKKNLRSRIFKLIETNDLPYKVENVDLLFNHTPGLNEDQFDIVDSEVKLYLGLNYVLLRSAFLEKAKNYQESKTGSGIFVCFGGADTFDLGLRFVKGLLARNFQDPIYWISNKSKEVLLELSANVDVIWGLNQYEMIKHMSKSKILLIPASVLSFEAIALRKPFYSGYFVQNQELNAKGLLKNMLAEGCKNLNTHKDFEEICDDLLNFYFNELKQHEIVSNQKKFIDGNSSLRLREIIKSL